ncbi:MAG: cysteine desulfurase [Nitrospirae bacterium]|nr:cysteine desulfurase [Nitrospirota bacterium]
MGPFPVRYFDHINCAPPLEEVVRAMAPWLSAPADPQAEHAAGRRAHMALEAARAQVAALIGAYPAAVLFTATGSEANNLAVKGYLKANRRRGTRILVSAVEHPSVERACRRMTADGYTLDTLPVDRHGRVDPDHLARHLTDDTALVCVQLANPEVGTVQPIAEIASRLAGTRAALMVDAVAAAGRMPIHVEELGADLLTLSASTLGGPAGAAALYVRRGLRVQPEIDGGVQENGQRGGLENVAAAVGFGVAAGLTAQRLADASARLNALAERFRAALSGHPAIAFSGHPETRLPGHVSLLVAGAEGQSLLTLLDKAGVAAASGSHCGAKAMKASPVLTAMGYPAAQALSGVVFSFGPGNSPEEVDQGVELLQQCIDDSQRALPGAAG